MNVKTRKSCSWPSDNPLMIKYHDTEWGVPVHDDRKHFEYMILDGAQAGLSWQTVLNKRENYRKAFHNFDPARIARYTQPDVRRLLGNSGIIRNRLKIQGAVISAKKFLEVQKEFGSFDSYIWRFVGGKPIRNKFKSLKNLPPRSKESDALSADLKKRGFKFVGSTICYAYMQAAGLVNDHMIHCFRYKVIS